MLSKKAVSEIVSYVILVVIALTMSIIVYGFLQTQIPKEHAECPGEISLILRDYSCEGSNEIDLIFQNKGNFKIDGVYVKYSNDSEGTAVSALETGEGIDPSSNSITDTEGKNGFLYFGKGDFPLALSPNREYRQTFEYSGILRKVQIQPFILSDEDELVICDDRTISQPISCS